LLVTRSAELFAAAASGKLHKSSISGCYGTIPFATTQEQQFLLPPLLNPSQLDFGDAMSQ